jgi:hypothetical protein
LGLKYLNSLIRIRDPGWRQFGSGIRDGKKSDPGSATLVTVFTFIYNDISVVIIFYTRWDSAREWDDQYHNYQKIMDYVNSHPELGVDIQWGTLRQGDFTHYTTV